MGFLKSLMIRIGADASGVDKELKKASKALVAAGKDWEKAGATMTKAVTLPIVAIGGAAIKMGLEVAETEQKFDYAFGSMADSVRDWSNAYSKARGLNAYEVRSTAASFVTMAKGFGVSGTAAAKMAQDLTDAAASLAEVYEVDDATMVENFMSAMKGRANALKEFGIVIDDTTQKAYAYTHGIAAAGEELNSNQKLLANYGIIMSQASDEMANFASTGKDLATTIKNKLNTALSDFGTKLIQTGTFDKIVDALIRFLDAASDLAVAFGNLSPGMQDFIVKSALVVAAIGPMLSGIGNLIQMFGALGLSAAGAGGSMAGAFAVGAAIVGAGGAVAGANRAKGGLSYSSTLSGAMTDKNGLSFADRLARDLEGSASGGYAGSGFKGAHFNRAAAEAGMDTTGMTLEPDKQDATLKYMEEYNKLLEEQQKKLAATAALDTFKSSVKSLAQAMMDATRQFANFVGMFDKVDREQVSGGRLARRMQGQLQAMQDWVAAMKSIKGKVSGALYRELLNLGPSAVDEIVALANDDGALKDYAIAWQQKWDLASGMGSEAAKANYKAEQVIEKQINNITVTGSDPQKIADLVVQRLRLAGVR